MRSRNVFIGLVCAALFQVPLLAFHFSGRSFFVDFWEPAADHYYSSLSILHGDFGAIFIVQGIPMAWLQTQFQHVISHLQPQEVGSVAQIDLFAAVTVWFAYLSIGLLIFCLWISRGWSMAIAIWPLTRDYYFLLAPFYWIYEFPIYLVSILWALRVIQRYREGTIRVPGMQVFMLAGIWCGLAFLQKPSLTAIALLPSVLALILGRASWLRSVWAAMLLLLGAAASHWFFFQLYLEFHQPQAMLAYRNYWNWLLHNPDAGTSLAGSFWELLRGSNFLFVPILIGLVALVVNSIAAFRGNLVTGRSRASSSIVIFLWLVALGHVFVVFTRPSGTSVTDAMFFGAFAVPITIGLAAQAGQKRLIALFSALVVIGCLFYQPAPFGHWAKVNELSTLRSIEAVRVRVRQIHRPVILLLPDNRIHPYTAEAFGLYTGHLNLAVDQTDERLLPRRQSAALLRQQLFPDTYIINRGENAQLAAAINAGFLIMWGEGPKHPRIQDDFPEIDGLLRRPNLSHDVFEMLPNGIRNAHLAYLRDVAAPTLH
jgi:hypothetical protein